MVNLPAKDVQEAPIGRELHDPESLVVDRSVQTPEVVADVAHLSASRNRLNCLLMHLS